MEFLLQYRDAPSDTPIIEFRSPYPLPVPRVGERVQLFDEHSALKAAGRVDAVDWGIRPRSAGMEELADTLDIAVRVWIQQERTTELSTPADSPP